MFSRLQEQFDSKNEPAESQLKCVLQLHAEDLAVSASCTTGSIRITSQRKKTWFLEQWRGRNSVDSDAWHRRNFLMAALDWKVLRGAWTSMQFWQILRGLGVHERARWVLYGFVLKSQQKTDCPGQNRYSSNTWSERMVFISYNRFEANWTMIWPWPFNLRNAEEFEERLVPRQILQPIWGCKEMQRNAKKCKEMQRNAMFVPDQFPHSSPAFAAWHIVGIGTSPRLGRSSHRYSVLETPNDCWLVCC